MAAHFGRQRSCPGDANRKSADSSPRTHVQFAHVGISNGRISATHGRRRYETMFHMHSWPDRRLLDLLKIELPIIQAPMAVSDSVALARSVSSTGALGSLACALLSPDEVREAVRFASPGDEATLQPKPFLPHHGSSRCCRSTKMEEFLKAALRPVGARH